MTIVIVFDSDDALVVFGTGLCRLLQFQCMSRQAAQGGCQLIERRFCQSLGIKLNQDSFAAQQQVALQIALQSFVLTLSPHIIRAPQIGFFRQPAAQSRQRYLQHIADQGGIAIVLVDLVKRVDLGFQRITARHD